MELAHTVAESTKSTDSAYFGHMGGGSPLFFSLMMIFWAITWLLIIIVLVLFIIRLWKQIQKENKL